MAKQPYIRNQRYPEIGQDVREMIFHCVEAIEPKIRGVYM